MMHRVSADLPPVGHLGACSRLARQTCNSQPAAASPLQMVPSAHTEPGHIPFYGEHSLRRSQLETNWIIMEIKCVLLSYAAPCRAGPCCAGCAGFLHCGEHGWLLSARINSCPISCRPPLQAVTMCAGGPGRHLVGWAASVLASSRADGHCVPLKEPATSCARPAQARPCSTPTRPALAVLIHCRGGGYACLGPFSMHKKLFPDDFIPTILNTSNMEPYKVRH